MKIEKERRKHKRLKYEALISHDVSSDDIIHPGKMFNFSKGGLYFESDVVIHPGEKLNIGLVADADHSGKNAQLLFEVEVVWQRKQNDLAFRYGYGGKFSSFNESFYKSQKGIRDKRPSSAGGEFNAEIDSRKHRRRKFNKSLLFIYTRQKHRGVVLNFSRAGAFIKIKGVFSLGEMITFSVSSPKTRQESTVKGWIVRIGQGGIGVSFERRSGLERRSDLDRRTGADRRRPKKERLSA